MFEVGSRVRVVLSTWEDVQVGSEGTVSQIPGDGFIMVNVDGFVPSGFDTLMAALTQSPEGSLPFDPSELELVEA